MEALETVVGYWEDALSAYRSNSLDTAAASGKSVPPPPMLTTAEETVFVRLLENILEGAYQLQARGCFLHCQVLASCSQALTQLLFFTGRFRVDLHPPELYFEPRK